MNWDALQGNWKELKGKIRSHWGKLTDDDLETIAGKKDMLLGRLQHRYGFHKEQAEREIDSFVNAMPPKAKDRIANADMPKKTH